MGCKDFFTQHGGDKKKCKLLQDKTCEQLTEWESQSATDLSPGIVHNDERLYQQIVDPTHINPDGTGLIPTAFDDCSSHGLSIHRVEHTSMSGIIDMGHERAKKFNAENPARPQRRLWGVAPYVAGEVRRIISDASKDRAFFIFDTANVHDKSHAEICQGVKEPKTQRSVRFKLYDMVKGQLIPLDKLDVKEKAAT